MGSQKKIVWFRLRLQVYLAPAPAPASNFFKLMAAALAPNFFPVPAPLNNFKNFNYIFYALKKKIILGIYCKYHYQFYYFIYELSYMLLNKTDKK